MPAPFASLGPFDFAFLAGVLLLVHLSRRWMPLYALLALPGTALHEVSHWLVALLLGGRPTAPNLVPQRTEGRWRLGSVGIRRVRWFNALPIGLAPLLIAPLALLALGWAAGVDDRDWRHWTGLYVAAVAIACCVPSTADLRIVASRPLGLLAWVALAAGVAWAAWLR